MTDADSATRRRKANRQFRSGLFFFGSLVLFIGGSAALLYSIFSKYTGVQNLWLLVCGAPSVFFILIMVVIINLYFRFGRPLEELFSAINAVEGGDLTARVTERKSDMFSDLFKRFNRMVSELERAEQQRRNLTADIAHELRTPLHIIQGNLEGIVDGVYEPTTAHINATLDETQLIARLVTDLQTLSLIETGHLPLHPAPFLAADFLQDLEDSFGPQAAAQGIALTIHPAAPDLQITADYDRLNQVLSNLLSNALRYTPQGGNISVMVEALRAPEKLLRITVQDSGAGIPAADLPFIFDRFWRGDRARRERSHSGLGLAITHQLVLAHGGKIEARSEVGRGTTFVIDLPGG